MKLILRSFCFTGMTADKGFTPVSRAYDNRLRRPGCYLRAQVSFSASRQRLPSFHKPVRSHVDLFRACTVLKSVYSRGKRSLISRHRNPPAQSY